MGAAALAVALLIPTAGNASIVDQASQTPTRQQQLFADCVSHRESRNDPAAQSTISSSAGKWQFLQSQWGQSLPWMVAKRLRAFGMDPVHATTIRVRLQHTPIHVWSESLQDVGFVAVLNARGPWTGWRHWYLQGSPCNALAGAR